MFTLYEQSMLQAIYEYSRIPLWGFDDKFQIKISFTYDMDKEIKDHFLHHISKLMINCQSKDFDILCYENELYFIFSLQRKNKPLYLFGGPMLLSGIYHITKVKSLSFASGLNLKKLFSAVENLPVVSLHSFSSCLNILMLLFNKSSLHLQEISNYKYYNLQSSIHNHLLIELFEFTKESREHTPYSQETALLNCVKEGDITMLESLYRVLPQTKYGNMSNHFSPIRQLFYGSIANTTLVTRYAIEGGLDEETAFTLSDLYIKEMESCNTLYELNCLNEKMATDFTMRVSSAKTVKQTNFTKPVITCIDYINSNIHSKITLEDLANVVNLTPKYISFLFHKQTGQTISSFILDTKINRAKNLLIYSNFTFSEISQYLSFHSQSYFISNFKKCVGITPKKYRDKYYKQVEH